MKIKNILKKFMKGIDTVSGLDPEGQKEYLLQATYEQTQAQLLTKEEIEKIESDLMYDFSNSYSNTQISAYQRGLNKFKRAIHNKIKERL